MSEIIKRALEKQRLANPQGLTLNALLDKMYELANTKRMDGNARIVFHMAMYADFMCSHCGQHNTRAYDQTILDWEVDEENSTPSKLVIFIKKRK